MWGGRRRLRNALRHDRAVGHRQRIPQPGPRAAQAGDLGSVQGRGESDPNQGHRRSASTAGRSSGAPVQGDRAEDPRGSAQQILRPGARVLQASDGGVSYSCSLAPALAALCAMTGPR